MEPVGSAGIPSSATEAPWFISTLAAGIISAPLSPHHKIKRIIPHNPETISGANFGDQVFFF